MGLDMVELIIAVEDRFGIAIENREAEKVVTVGHLYQLVFDKLLSRGSVPTEQELYSQLREVICKQLGVKERDVVPSAHFIDDLGAD
jgi:acyl carrier protein